MKYLFKAEFTDGTSYTQNHEDIPLAGFGHGSCFSDINERVKDGKVTKFSLIGEHIWSVDLTDGHFEVDGIPFNVNAEIVPKLLTNYRLIYFRRVQQHANILQGETVSTSSEIVGFRFGWQANTPDGSNVQQIVEIS